MKQLLIINPNTSTSVTQLLVKHAKQLVPSDVEVQGVTARFGAPYIIDEASFAVASHATLDAWAAARSRAASNATSILIGCFGDPGLIALAQSSPAPVTGLASAAFEVAAKHGRFAIVTGGERWKPMLERLAHALGFSDRLAGIVTVAPNGGQLAANPELAKKLLAEACARAATDFKADAVILGGAGLAGIAAQIQSHVNVPLIDSVQAGIEIALKLMKVAPKIASAGFEVQFAGVSEEMTKLNKNA